MEQNRFVAHRQIQMIRSMYESRKRSSANELSWNMKHKQKQKKKKKNLQSECTTVFLDLSAKLQRMCKVAFEAVRHFGNGCKQTANVAAELIADPTVASNICRCIFIYIQSVNQKC